MKRTGEESNKKFNYIVDILQEYGQVTATQVSKLLDVSSEKAQNILKKTCDMGYAEPLGDINNLEMVTVKSMKTVHFDVKLRNAMDLCIEILLGNGEIDSFKNAFYQRDDEPYIIYFIMQNKGYQIIRIPRGKEGYYNKYFSRDKAVQGEDGDNIENYIVILEDASKKDFLDFSGIVAVFKETEEGEVVPCQ